MNRKMTLLALGAKCGIFGASGLTALAAGTVAAAALLLKKPSRWRRPERARPVKPAPACQRNSRRVRRQKVFDGLDGWVLIPTVSPSDQGGRSGVARVFNPCIDVW